MNEFDWIKRYLAPLATDPAALGLVDDAAFIQNPHSMVVSADALVENIHFLPTLAPRKLAKRILATNLSDIAAMGASPRYYTLTGCLPSAPTEDWAQAFCAGLADIHEQYGIALLGGDTTKTKGPASFSVTIMGETDTPMRRNAAQTGDDIWLSGIIGAAYLGLQTAIGPLEGGKPEWLEAYETPTPQIALGIALNAAGIACAMDVSDGLLGDLAHMCRASHVAAELRLEDTPLASQQHGVAAQLNGGDDYQLLFTAAPEKAAIIKKMGADLGIQLSNIGTVLCHNDTIHPVSLLKNGQKTSIEGGSFTHF